MVSKWTTALLEFAVRLYTRVHTEPHATAAGLFSQISMPKVKFAVDNGKRSIFVTLAYGPYWTEEDPDESDDPTRTHASDLFDSAP